MNFEILTGDSILMATALHEKWRSIYERYNDTRILNCSQIEEKKDKRQRLRNVIEL